MTHYYFIKLHHEVLHDPKMGQLPDRIWRRCIELFLLAGENDKDGELPDIQSMCWTLRVDQKELQAELDQLRELGILSFGEYDELIVTNFVKRQATQTGAERVERYRERKRKETIGVTKSYNNVTQLVTNTVPDIDIESDIDIDNYKEEKKTAKTVFLIYEEEIGMLTPSISDKLQLAEQDYTYDWLVKAIGIASANQKRSWAYIETILRNWKINGFDWRPGNNGNGKAKQTEPGFYAALREIKYDGNQ